MYELMGTQGNKLGTFEQVDATAFVNAIGSQINTGISTIVQGQTIRRQERELTKRTGILQTNLTERAGIEAKSTTEKAAIRVREVLGRLSEQRNLLLVILLGVPFTLIGGSIAIYIAQKGKSA